MRRIQILIIPDGANATRQFSVPRLVVNLLAVAAFFLASITGFLFFDYFQLRQLRQSYFEVIAENEGLKGEARLLMTNLEDVKRSLRRVHDYSTQLGELTQVRVERVSKETGIGPLTAEEMSIAKKQTDESQQQGAKPDGSNAFPLGINMEKLIFRPVFSQLESIGREANKNALELQHLLSDLSQQKTLLLSIPSITPVSGWITSGFGSRISPFTGQKAMHLGIDVASPVGTPIYAPADGVVIFSGAKEGYGNFLMIAHGYGIVSRYGHNAQNLVHAGQKIRRGDQIATVGMSGRTTGPHLHYEILVNSRPVNPRKFILDNLD